MLLSELLAICRGEMAAVPDAAPGEAEFLAGEPDAAERRETLSRLWK